MNMYSNIKKTSTNHWLHHKSYNFPAEKKANWSQIHPKQPKPRVKYWLISCLTILDEPKKPSYLPGFLLSQDS